MSMRRGLTTITVLLALTGLLATHALAGDTKSDNRGGVFYLSVGTSLSVGIQPNRAGRSAVRMRRHRATPTTTSGPRTST